MKNISFKPVTIWSFFTWFYDRQINFLNILNFPTKTVSSKLNFHHWKFSWFFIYNHSSTLTHISTYSQIIIYKITFLCTQNLVTPEENPGFPNLRLNTSLPFEKLKLKEVWAKKKNRRLKQYFLLIVKSLKLFFHSQVSLRERVEYSISGFFTGSIFILRLLEFKKSKKRKLKKKWICVCL